LLYQKLGTRLWNTSRASHDIIWAWDNIRPQRAALVAVLAK
jgi:hypothetical protein